MAQASLASDAIGFKSPLFAALSTAETTASSSHPQRQRPIAPMQKVPAYMALQPKIQSTHRAQSSVDSTGDAARAQLPALNASANVVQPFPKSSKIRYNNYVARPNKDYEQLAKIYGWETPQTDTAKASGLLGFKLPTWLKSTSSSIAVLQTTSATPSASLSSSRLTEEQQVSAPAVVVAKRASDSRSFTSFTNHHLSSDDETVQNTAAAAAAASLYMNAVTGNGSAVWSGHARSLSTPDDHSLRDIDVNGLHLNENIDTVTTVATAAEHYQSPEILSTVVANYLPSHVYPTRGNNTRREPQPPSLRRGKSDESIRGVEHFTTFPPSIYLSSESSSSENRQSFLESHYARPPTIIHSKSVEVIDAKHLLEDYDEDDSDHDESTDDPQSSRGLSAVTTSITTVNNTSSYGGGGDSVPLQLSTSNLSHNNSTLNAFSSSSSSTRVNGTIHTASTSPITEDISPTRVSSPIRPFLSSTHPPLSTNSTQVNTMQNILDCNLPEENDFGLPPATHSFWTSYSVFDTPDSEWNVRFTRLTSSTNDASGRLIGATSPKLIEILTTSVDYTFLSDFLLVYRCFMSPIQLAKLLILRFRWAMAGDSDKHILVRMRTFIVLRNWIVGYYHSDFIACRPLRFIIITFINELSHNNDLRAQKRDYRLIKALKKLLKQHDSDYKQRKMMHGQSGSEAELSDWLFHLEMEKEYEPINVVLSSYLERAQVAHIQQQQQQASTTSIHPMQQQQQLNMLQMATSPASMAGSLDSYFPQQHNNQIAQISPGSSGSWSGRRVSASEASINTASNGGNTGSVIANSGSGAPKREWSLKSSISNIRKHITPDMHFSGGGYDYTDGDIADPVSTDVYRRINYERTLSTASTATTISTVSNISNTSISPAMPSLGSPTYPLSGGLSQQQQQQRPPQLQVHVLHSLPGVPFVPIAPSTTLAHLSWALSPLSRTPVVDKDTGRRRSFILAYKSEIVAQHLTVIEETLLRGVRWTELLEGRWKKNVSMGSRSSNDALRPLSWQDAELPPTKSNERSDGIQLMIERFNLICQWVATEVCGTKNIDERVKIIEKFIRIANKCYATANYSSLIQIMLGLQNPHVDRLKKTWAKVGSPERRAFKDLSTFTSPLKNFAGLREAMKQISEGDSHGIPFTGLYLSDLVFNNELPTYLTPPPNSSLPLPSLYSDGIAVPPLPIINYHKFQVMASIISQFKSFQDMKQRYSFDIELKVYACCLCLRTVSNDDLAIMSNECEPRDVKK